jgi:hypothetical protein
MFFPDSGHNKQKHFTGEAYQPVFARAVKLLLQAVLEMVLMMGSQLLHQEKNWKKTLFLFDQGQVFVVDFFQ